MAIHGVIFLVQIATANGPRPPIKPSSLSSLQSENSPRNFSTKGIKLSTSLICTDTVAS